VLDKADGFVALPGNLVINNGATVNAARAGQFGNSTNVTLNSGTLNCGFSTTFGSLTVISGATTYLAPAGMTLTTTSPFALTLGGGLSFNGAWTFTGASGGGIQTLGNGSSPATLSGPINFGGVNRMVSVPDNAQGDDLTLSGDISSGGITKAGIGTLALLGANTYSGTTIINGGVVRIAADNGLGSAASPLQLFGSLETSSTMTLSHPVTTSFGALRPADGTRLTIGAPISGNYLFLNGGGTLVLAVPNTYSGYTWVTKGTVALANDAALGASSLGLSGGSVRAEGQPRVVQNFLWLDANSNSEIQGPLDLTFAGGIMVAGPMS